MARAWLQVFLSTGKIGGIPRTFRGRDIFEFLGGAFRQSADEDPPARLYECPPITGATRALSFYSLAAEGAQLCGRTKAAHPDGRGVSFAGDLFENIAVSQVRTSRFSCPFLGHFFWRACLRTSGVVLPPCFLLHPW
jgi:putative flavoprotein involved in K+ transport